MICRLHDVEEGDVDGDEDVLDADDADDNRQLLDFCIMSKF